jgi:hypothetical protein
MQPRATDAINQTGNQLAQSIIRPSVGRGATNDHLTNKKIWTKCASNRTYARQVKSELLTPLQSPKAGHETNRYY